MVRSVNCFSSLYKLSEFFSCMYDLLGRHGKWFPDSNFSKFYSIDLRFCTHLRIIHVLDEFVFGGGDITREVATELNIQYFDIDFHMHKFVSIIIYYSILIEIRFLIETLQINSQK